MAAMLILSFAGNAGIRVALTSEPESARSWVPPGFCLRVHVGRSDQTGGGSSKNEADPDIGCYLLELAEHFLDTLLL